MTRALKARLLGDKEELHTTGGTHDARAYQYYLLGMHYRNRGALRDTVQRAQDAFEQAISLDPGYAKAHAALACTWVDKVWNGYTTHAEGIRRIDEDATRAIELAPDLADGYLAPYLGSE